MCIGDLYFVLWTFVVLSVFAISSLPRVCVLVCVLCVAAVSPIKAGCPFFCLLHARLAGLPTAACTEESMGALLVLNPQPSHTSRSTSTHQH